MYRNPAVTTLVLLIFHVYLANAAFSSPSLLPNVQMETVGNIIQKSTECMRQAGPILFKPSNAREGMINHISKQILKFSKCPAPLLPYCKIGHQLRIIYKFMNKLKNFPGLVEKVMTGPMKCWTDVICLLRDNTIVTQCGDNTSVPKIVENAQKERVRRPGVYNSHKVLIKKKISYEKSPKQMTQRGETTTLKPMVTKLESDLSQPTASPPSQITVMQPPYPAGQSPVAPQTEADSSIYEMNPNQNYPQSDLPWEFPIEMLPAFGLPISSPQMGKASISTFLANQSHIGQNTSDPNQTPNEHDTRYEMVDHDIQISSNEDSLSLEFDWEPQNNYNFDGTVSSIIPNQQQLIPNPNEITRPQPNNASDQSQTEVVDHNVQILSNQDSPALDSSWQPENSHTFSGQHPSTLLTQQQSIPDQRESSRPQKNQATGQSETDVVDHDIQILSNQDSPALDSSWQPENSHTFSGQLPSTLITQQQYIPDQHESSRPHPNLATDQSQTEVVDHNIQILSDQDSPALDSSWQPENSHTFSGQLPSTLLTQQQSIPDQHELSSPKSNQATDQSQTEVVDHNVQILSNQDSPALDSSWQPENSHTFSGQLPATLLTHQQSIPDLHESSRSQPNQATDQLQTDMILSNHDSPALYFSWEPEKTNEVDGQLPSTLPTHQQAIPDHHESSRPQPNQATDQSQTEVVDHNVQIASNHDSPALDFSWEPEKTNKVDEQLPSTLVTHQQSIPDLHESSRREPNHETDLSQTEVVDHNIQISSNQDSPALDFSWDPEKTNKVDGQLPSTLPTYQQFVPDLHDASRPQPNQDTDQSQTEVVDHNVQILSNQDSPALDFSWEHEKTDKVDGQLPFTLPTHQQPIPDLHESSRPEPNHATDESQTDVVDHNVQILSNQDSPVLDFSWVPEKTNKVDGQLPYTLPIHQQSIPDLHESSKPEPNHATDESQTEVVDHNVQILSNHDSPALNFSWQAQDIPSFTNEISWDIEPSYAPSIPKLEMEKQSDSTLQMMQSSQSDVLDEKLIESDSLESPPNPYAFHG